MDNVIKGAIITALGAIIAAIIVGTFSYCSRPSDSSQSNQVSIYNPIPVDTPNIATTTQPNSNIPHIFYEANGEIGVGKSYIDKETGFVFAVDEITDFLGTTGALCWFTYPNGKVEELYRRDVGFRTNFQYQGRNFFMVIEDIDYDRKVAKIKVRETY